MNVSKYLNNQRGIALITVLMVVALSTTFAAFLIWTVNNRILVHEMHYHRLQNRLVIQTGVEWAASMLLADLRQFGKYDSLNEIWAQPLPTLPVRIIPDDPNSAIEIGGYIEDAQGKFNLNNIAYFRGNNRLIAKNALYKLFKINSIPFEVATNIVDWIDSNDETENISSVESDYYLNLEKPHRTANQPISEIANLSQVRGITAQHLEILRKHISFLPRSTKVNVNTATAGVLCASIPNLSYADAVVITENRKHKPFTSINDFINSFPKKARKSISKRHISVRSDFFIVHSSATQRNNIVRSKALIERKSRGWPMVWWQQIL